MDAEKKILRPRCIPFSLRAKSKIVLFCCTLLEEKVEWFYKLSLVASILKVGATALWIWYIRDERIRDLTERDFKRLRPYVSNLV